MSKVFVKFITIFLMGKENLSIDPDLEKVKVILPFTETLPLIDVPSIENHQRSHSLEKCGNISRTHH